MNMLKNKKGFTLIEMLVVIAIIAVLVAIIIPVVGSSTTKATAATNAANLRSYKAALTTAYLSGDIKSDGSAVNSSVTAPTAPTAKKMDNVDAADAKFDFDNGTFYVYFEGTGSEKFDIDDFAAVAEAGGAVNVTGATSPVTGG